MDLGDTILSVSTGFLTVLVYVLAVMRITRLINGDTILDWLRAIPMNKAHAARNAMNQARRSGQLTTAAMLEKQSRRWSMVLYYLECPWCVGMWIVFGTVWIPMFFAHVVVFQYIGFALAASHLIGVFAFAADTEEVEVEEDTA